MNTITLWLLVSAGSHAYGSGVNVIERFVTAAECERVAALVRPGAYESIRCIQTTVYKP